MKKIHKNYILKQLVITVITALACLSLVIGLAMAWYTDQYRLASIGKIHPLTAISILAPGDSVIQSIDLSYDKSEVHDGKVELKRPFVIRSESQKYDLCIAHTTNISGLRIQLYEAYEVLDNEKQKNAYLAGITDKGLPYYWNKKDNTKDLFEKDKYLNRDDSNEEEVIADKTHSAHDKTFPYIDMGNEKIYDKVQKNASPLYWVKKGIVGEKRTPDDGNFYTNYILEISWNETDKETDILYIIARTSDTEDTEVTNE